MFADGFRIDVTVGMELPEERFRRFSIPVLFPCAWLAETYNIHDEGKNVIHQRNEIEK